MAAACAGGRQPAAGKGPSDEQLRHRGRSRAHGRAGRRARQGGDPAPGRSTSSGSGRAAVARYCARAMGLLWFAVTLRLAGQGLGWAVPAYLALAFVCLVLAVIDAATGLLPTASLPGVPGRARAAAGRQPRPGRAWPARPRPARGGLGRRVVPAADAAVSARHGVGDVKLAPTLDLALGWLSWGTVAVGVVAGFLLGGLAGLAGMVALGLSRTSWLPFGPWLVRRGAAGRPGRRRGRRLVPGRLARRQVGRVSSCGR